MRQREFTEGLGFTTRHVDNPVVYVEIEEGVYAEVVGVHSTTSKSLGLKEKMVILLQISDPEESQ